MLVVLVMAGSWVTRRFADPTFSADLSVGYSHFADSPWLSLNSVFPETTKDFPFISDNLSLLSLLYPREENFIYFAKRGETFSSIAAKLGLEASVLQKANPKTKKINAGQEVIVPFTKK